MNCCGIGAAFGVGDVEAAKAICIASCAIAQRSNAAITLYLLCRRYIRVIPSLNVSYHSLCLPEFTVVPNFRSISFSVNDCWFRLVPSSGSVEIDHQRVSDPEFSTCCTHQALPSCH